MVKSSNLELLTMVRLFSIRFSNIGVWGNPPGFLSHFSRTTEESSDKWNSLKNFMKFSLELCETCVKIRKVRLKIT